MTSFADHLAVARDESKPLARRIEAAGEAWLDLGQSTAYHLDNYNALDDAEDSIIAAATRYDRIVDAVTKWVDSGADLCSGEGHGLTQPIGLHAASDAARAWLRALLSP